MENYSQPDFYHFNSDSILLVNWAIVQEALLGPSINSQVLDLCAGCGIVGIDFIKKYNSGSVQRVVFLELQKEYVWHLQKNIDQFYPSNHEYQIINSSFLTNVDDSLYDIILCNPPYYSPQRGKIPVSVNRMQSRFMIGWEAIDLLNYSFLKLREGGRFYCLDGNDNFSNLDLKERADEYKISYIKEVKGPVTLYQFKYLH